MAGEDGLGKASKARKHQAARTPYARPKSAAAPGTDVTPLLGNSSEAPDTAGNASLLGSVFSAATTPLRAVANNLINRVSPCLLMLVCRTAPQNRFNTFIICTFYIIALQYRFLF